MGTQAALSTTHDVVLDTMAALDMFTGAFGSEETTIDGVTETARDRLEVTLSNGEVYELRVRPMGRA